MPALLRRQERSGAKLYVGYDRRPALLSDTVEAQGAQWWTKSLALMQLSIQLEETATRTGNRVSEQLTSAEQQKKAGERGRCIGGSGL